MNSAKQNLLHIEGLTLDFRAFEPSVHRALQGVSIKVAEGEILGLVGESGAGKTVFAHAVLGLLPRLAHISAGTVEWRGRDLLKLDERELRRIRGKEIAMIFQDPQASLNPIYTIEKQMKWILKLHRGIIGDEAVAEARRLFEAVKLRDPARCAASYPHELSGGMCQRVMIAMALAGNPQLLIADEPTSALDVSVAAEIVSLLAHLRDTFGLSILIITHDLGVATRLADTIAVLDQGQLVEQVPSQRFWFDARHAASRKLIDASRFLSAAIQTNALATIDSQSPVSITA